MSEVHGCEEKRERYMKERGGDIKRNAWLVSKRVDFSWSRMLQI